MKAFWLETGETISVEELKSHGINYEKLDTNNYQKDLDRIKTTYKYSTQDIVELTPQTQNLDVILAKFDKEHLHTDDEVRFVLAGSGIFDIRAHDNKWMRVEVTSGD